MNAYREQGPDNYGRRPGQYPLPAEEEQTVVNAGRLWAGGMAAAVVSGLVALVGLLVARAVFQVPLLSAKRFGAFGDSSTVTLVVLAVAAALLATGLAHLLLISTPSPQSYFGWIVGLLTVAAVVTPFLGTGSVPVRMAQAVIYLVIGIAIGGLVSNAASAASRTTVARR
ncbi:MAG: DUF6069 family protein [Actinomycetota bacterium]|nr:hypothetical protein [Pseudonocardiales bacterium]MDQ2709352.1 DUF6069 family protein [Actinomycetota bacterium]